MTRYTESKRLYTTTCPHQRRPIIQNTRVIIHLPLHYDALHDIKATGRPKCQQTAAPINQDNYLKARTPKPYTSPLPTGPPSAGADAGRIFPWRYFAAYAAKEARVVPAAAYSSAPSAPTVGQAIQ